jgi:uncharacterized membrane protein
MPEAIEPGTQATDVEVRADAAPGPAPDAFTRSLEAERGAERTVMRSIVRSVTIGVPIGIVFFVALLFLAVGDDLGAWVIIAVGVMLGLIAAVLFGMLGGVTLAAHAFEDVDRGGPSHG